MFDIHWMPMDKTDDDNESFTRLESCDGELMRHPEFAKLAEELHELRISVERELSKTWLLRVVTKIILAIARILPDRPFR